MPMLDGGANKTDVEWRLGEPVVLPIPRAGRRMCLLLDGQNTQEEASRH